MTSPLPQGANSDRWRRIEEVCDDALPLAPAERALYLAAACGDDAVLRGEVEKLLAHEESAEQFLAQPMDAVAARVFTDAPEPDLVGVRLGDYEIVAKLGAGGMGVVYRAKDRRLGRDVAIKVLPTALELDEARLARFEREARLLATVNHPHIGAIYGLVEADGLRALVLELVEGETLATALGRGKLPVERSLALAAQTADALAHAHRRGVVHRDLKPSNIMLTAGGVKLLDFGVGKWSPKDGESPLPGFSTLTEDGAIVGTIHYMSPEQLEGRTADARSDLFSFGAVLFEMLAGRTAFDGRSQASIIAAILEGPTPRLPEIGGVPLPRLERVVAKCLAKDPDQRWQSARDLGDELEWIAREIGLPQTPELHASSRRRWMVLTVALLCLIAGGLITLVATRPQVTPVSSRPLAQSITRFTVQPPAGAVMSINFAFALSPDGRHLVYWARAGNESHLYLRTLDQLESRVLSGTEGASVPTFSPDGQWVAFVAGGKLKKVSVLTNAPAITVSEVTGCCAGGLTWLPDDRIVLGRSGGGVVAVSASGGTPVVLSEPDRSRGELGLLSPQPLPGGRSLLVSVHRGVDTFDVAVFDLDTGTRRVLVANAFNARYVPTGHLVFARTGTLFAAPFDVHRLEMAGPAVAVVEDLMTVDGGGMGRYQIGSDGTLAYLPAISVQSRRLVWVDRHGRREQLPIGPRGFVAPSLSPRGERLVVQVNERTGRDIWVYNLGSGVMDRLTFDGTSTGPIWTPDGQRVVFSSTQNGRRQIYWQAADAIGQPELLVSNYNAWAGSWSPAQTSLAYAHSSRNGFDVSLFGLAGRRSAVVVASPAEEQWPRISPDGRWLAYVSLETGRFEVYVTPLPDFQGRRQLSTEGGSSPVWSRDGRELFYRSIGGERMMVMPVSSLPGAPGRPISLPGNFRIANGTVAHPGYDVSLDGRRLLVVEPAEDEAAPASLHVVLNWFDELKQRVPTR